jgi:hypothetical protein
MDGAIVMSTLYKMTFGHQTGLCRAVDANDCEKYMERRIGLDNGPVKVELATEDDEAWFKGMGGGFIYCTPEAHQEDREDE